MTIKKLSKVERDAWIKNIRESLYSALYVSEGWHVARNYMPKRDVAYRAQAVILFDRVLNGEFDKVDRSADKTV